MYTHWSLSACPSIHPSIERKAWVHADSFNSNPAQVNSSTPSYLFLLSPDSDESGYSYLQCIYLLVQLYCAFKVVSEGTMLWWETSYQFDYSVCVHLYFVFIPSVFSYKTLIYKATQLLFPPSPLVHLYHSFVIQLDSSVTTCISSWVSLYAGVGWGVQIYGF